MKEKTSLSEDKSNKDENLIGKSAPITKIKSLEKNITISSKKNTKEKEAPTKNTSSSKLKKSEDIEKDNKMDSSKNNDGLEKTK